MGTTLMVAAGGGGDAITAAALGPALGLTGDLPVVLTYAWDRLIIDPLPGPRGVADFTGLHEPAPDVREVRPTTHPVPPARSTLPRLAAELPARILLLDPTEGAVGMARQIRAAADHLDADAIALVDVGGDILTDGTDPGLRSPLADLLALAACVQADLPTRVYVPGPGLDGEIPDAVVRTRVGDLGGEVAAVLDTDAVRPARSVVAWHPSEATGMLVAAARGTRGTVEVRDAADRITLTDHTADVLAVDADRLTGRLPLTALGRSESLAAAERVVHAVTGISELVYERRKAALADPSEPSAVPDLDSIDAHAAAAAARGVDFVSVRRLAGLTGVTTWDDLKRLQQLLANERRSRYVPPIFDVAGA